MPLIDRLRTGSPGRPYGATREADAAEAAHIAWLEPDSIAAEQYRLLHTRLNQMRARRPIRIIAVTSSVQGEGKTTTSLNLGLVMARDFGLKTVLLDGDLKKIALSRLAGGVMNGWIEVVAGDVPLDDALVPHLHENLLLLGASKPLRDSMPLISSPKFGAMMDELRARFDCIILDAPPIIPLADMSRYAELCDAIVVLVRSGMTKASILKQALGTLDDHRDKIVGAVLSRVDPSQMSYLYAWPKKA
jgi:capsular exopolysaccharide synthesis family protein